MVINIFSFSIFDSVTILNIIDIHNDNRIPHKILASQQNMEDHLRAKSLSYPLLLEGYVRKHLPYVLMIKGSINLAPSYYSSYIIWGKFASEFLIFVDFPKFHLILKAYRIQIRSKEEHLDKKGPFHTEWLSKDL